MARPAPPVAAPPALEQPGADYPALFATYVTRSAETLPPRFAPGAVLSRDEFLRQRDTALHVLTFAFGLDAAWPAARDLLLALAEPMERAGERGDWLPFLIRGRARSQALADAAAAAELTLHIGHLLRLMSDFTGAQQELTASLAGFRQLGDSAGAARALNQLAYVACLEHRHAAAVEQAEAALQLLAADAPERAMSHFVLGMVALDRWQWEEAEAQHRQALAIRQQQGDLRRIAWAQQNIGYALQGQRRYAEAIDHFQMADSTLDELDDQANRAIVLLNLARTCHLSGQLAEALATGQAARQALHTVGDRLHAAHAAITLGLVYLALADPRAALASFEDAVATYRALADAPGRLNATSGVALALLALEDYAATAAVLAPALEELAPLDNVPGKQALLAAMRQSLALAQTELAHPQVRVATAPAAH